MAEPPHHLISKSGFPTIVVLFTQSPICALLSGLSPKVECFISFFTSVKWCHHYGEIDLQRPISSITGDG